MKRTAMSLLLLSLFTLSLTACNTVAGVGKDVQEVGEEVEDAAD